ncbi:Gfo/Idh/MocA family protein [Ruania alba]|uniref:Predicted dehydrogenase n=1 Tax=Ruania alba TaxID=648782 RepID=A0A1H5LL66_9MICO|nr:Gfo/Idh/MocA family oxidoreductase [Ruania alba]SEE77739.1 Predicted dehydrogenase [Ruania alba]
MASSVAPRPAVALIGAGAIAAVHVRAIRAAGARLVGVLSSTSARSSAAAERLGAERSYPRLDALLADDAVEVVHICSPPGAHNEHVRAALAAGKHVVCEKPLATTPAEAADLADLAALSGRVCAVPFAYRYHPMAVEAHTRARTGKLGRIVSLRGAYQQEWRLVYDEDGWWSDPGQTGPSRAFADIGSHLVDLVEFTSAERIARVHAVMRTVLPQSPAGHVLTTEDVAAVTVETTSGAIGTLQVSQMSLGRKNSLTVEVYGADASHTFDQESPESLWTADRRGGREIVRDIPSLSDASARLSILPGGHPMGYQDAFTALVTDAYVATTGACPAELPTFDDGARAAAVVDAVVRSANQGSWTDVAESPTLRSTT